MFHDDGDGEHDDVAEVRRCLSPNANPPDPRPAPSAPRLTATELDNPPPPRENDPVPNAPVTLADRDTLGGRLTRVVLALKRIRWRSSPDPTSLQLRDGEMPLDGLLAILLHVERTYRRVPLLSEVPTERARSIRLLEQSLPVMQLPRRGGTQGLVPHRQRLVQALTDLEQTLAEHPDRKTSAFAVGQCVCLGGLAITVVAREATSVGLELDAYPYVHHVLTGIGRLPEVLDAYKPSKAGYVEHMRPEQRDAYLAKATDVLTPLTRKLRFLETIGWSRAIEEEFFAKGACTLPQPRYEFDREHAKAAIPALERLHDDLLGEHVMLDWLRATVRSFVDAYRMLLAIGTTDFYHRSLELYGGASTTAFDRDSTNLDLAAHIERRIDGQARFVEAEALDTSAFVAFMQAKLAARQPRIELEVVRDKNLSAKVICGRTRMRVREGATFGQAEAEGLWLHEVETHALTAQNGAAQVRLPLLVSGGPRTTRTQEGLAVFSELYGGALSSPRLLRIAQRVRLVGMAEDGASFLDLYRVLVERGLPERDAYLDAQRVCRGGLVGGGAPFTKDACYLAGLLDIYTLLRFMLRQTSSLFGELFVSGRVHADDLLALLWLRSEGVLDKPRYMPSWASDWDVLLAYFAFSSFLSEVDSDLTPNWPDDVAQFVNDCTAKFDAQR
jgi:uncharacterized protein (TIGR02421 family)